MSNSKTQITKRKTKAQKNGRPKTKVCTGVQLLIKGTVILSITTREKLGEWRSWQEELQR